MKLRIITGRAGAGKSKLVLETIAAQRFERPQILLVPEHATHEAELDLCRALGDTASRDGEVLSFQSLATRVLSQTGGISDITLDNGGKILIMRLAGSFIIFDGVFQAVTAPGLSAGAGGPGR